MNRSLAFAAFLTLGSLATLGCGPKEFGSVCSTAPAPPECQTDCDPTPGAPAVCPSGYFCAPDGKCDAQCTQTGGECGDGYVCSSEGRCIGDDQPPQSGPDASCPAVVFTPMPVTPSIDIVIDGSGSMAGTDISPNRYDATVTALTGAMGVVRQLEDKAYFGSHIYYCNGGQQLQSVTRALNNANAIDSSIAPFNVGGNTPTAEAVNDVVAGFASNPPPAGSPKIIVLATDGLPNLCNDGGSNQQPQAIQAVAAAYAAGITTYVLAINTGNSDHFQRLANVGQGLPEGNTGAAAAPFYPASSAAQLAQAFQTIINGVISCDLTLTSNIDPTQAMQGTVTVNGVALTYGVDWTLVNGNTIRIEGAACTSLKTTPNPQVSATFPCGSVIF